MSSGLSDYPELMLRAEVAEYLRCTVRTVQNLESRGDLEVCKIGSIVRIPRHEGERFLSNKAACAETSK